MRKMLHASVLQRMWSELQQQSYSINLSLTRSHPLSAECRNRRRDCMGCHRRACWIALKKKKNTTSECQQRLTRSFTSSSGSITAWKRCLYLTVAPGVHDSFCIWVIDKRLTNLEIRNQERSELLLCGFWGIKITSCCFARGWTDHQVDTSIFILNRLPSYYKVLIHFNKLYDNVYGKKANWKSRDLQTPSGFI